MQVVCEFLKGCYNMEIPESSVLLVSNYTTHCLKSKVMFVKRRIKPL